ncbi:MAG: hypothetical protein Q9169_007574 [Polycauliona sp. 2 TL-2023]
MATPAEKKAAKRRLVAPYLSEAGRETLQFLDQSPPEPIDGHWRNNFQKLTSLGQEARQRAQDIRSFQQLLEQRHETLLRAGSTRDHQAITKCVAGIASKVSLEVYDVTRKLDQMASRYSGGVDGNVARQAFSQSATSISGGALHKHSDFTKGFTKTLAKVSGVTESLIDRQQSASGDLMEMENQLELANAQLRTAFRNGRRSKVLFKRFRTEHSTRTGSAPSPLRRSARIQKRTLGNGPHPRA